MHDSCQRAFDSCLPMLCACMTIECCRSVGCTGMIRALLAYFYLPVLLVAPLHVCTCTRAGPLYKYEYRYLLVDLLAS